MRMGSRSVEKHKKEKHKKGKDVNSKMDHMTRGEHIWVGTGGKPKT
jgi:hypothetical protein